MKGCVMDEFTKAEIERINQLYGSDFKDITPDDATLIARWETQKALKSAEFKAREEALMTEMQAKVEQSQALYEQAAANLRELHDIAVRRLEAFDDGI